jgi:arylsulfatase A-like enzyme
VGRLMNRLADEKLLDETVVIYSSDHGLTLGEHGIVGKHASRAQWHIYHVPFMIRHPEGKLAGEWSDYFASTHDIPRTALSFMGARAPGMMSGEDLSVIFDGKEPAARPYFTSCYDDHVLAGDYEWFFISDSEGRRKRLYNRLEDPQEINDVAADHPELVDKYWRILEDEAGGTLPQFGKSGVIGG